MKKRDEIEPLRTSLRRIAEMTRDPEVVAEIPKGDPFNGIPYAERGWNRLAAILVSWVEDRNV